MNEMGKVQIGSHGLNPGEEGVQAWEYVSDESVFDKWILKKRQRELLDKNSVHSTQITFQKSWWF